MKKNIIHFIGQIGLGGTEKQLYLFLKYNNIKSFSHSIIVFNHSKYGDFAKKFSSLGVKLYFIPDDKDTVIKRFLFIFKLVVDKRPIILFSWTTHDNAYAGILGKIFNIKSIGSVRGSIHKTGFSTLPFLMKYICLRSVSILIINANDFRNDLSEFGIRNDNIKYVPNYVEINSNRNRSNKNHQQVIATIGNLRANKNHSFFIDLMSEIIESSPNTIGWIIGQPVDDEPNIENELLNKIKSMGLQGKVLLLGFHPNPLKLLRKSKVFVLPSLSEGAPNVILEAMSIGLPVVASNVGGIKDLIRSHKNGFLLDKNDKEGFKEIILKLLNDTRYNKSVGEKGYTYILNNHHPIEINKHFKSALRGLICV